MNFVEVENATAILVCRGVYRPAAIAKLGRELFARYGNGYIRLKSNNGTSLDKVNVLYHNIPGVQTNEFGHLVQNDG
jgi:hypothetical protein